MSLDGGAGASESGGTDHALLGRLPHREPFLFLSEVKRLEPGKTGTGVWRVTGTEAFFAGHFPGRPVVPGVLIAEALAQLSGLVGLHKEGGAPRGGRLAHVDLRIDRGVEPPGAIELSSTLSREFGALRMFDVLASVAGERVARGTLTLAIVGAEGGKGP